MRDARVTRNSRIVSSEIDPVAEIVVYTTNWNGDHAAEDDEAPNAQLNSRVVVNGEEMKFASGVSIEANGGDFVAASIRIIPSSIRFVHLSRNEFLADELPIDRDAE